jgi:hypothetical protein
LQIGAGGTKQLEDRFSLGRHVRPIYHRPEKGG